MKSVEDFFKTYHLQAEGETIIAGVSGGPDSMALLSMLNKHFGKSSVIIAAHVDHQSEDLNLKKI